VGSYNQWYTTASKGTVRRFTWVCGSEPVLVAEVVSTTVRNVQHHAQEKVFTQVGVIPESTIWELCSTVPVVPRLVVIQDAHKLQHLDRLDMLVEEAAALAGTWTVFVSEASDYPDAPQIQLLSKSSFGHLVKCSKPSEERDLIAWVQRQLPAAGKVLALYILKRCGTDLAAVAGVCAKARLFDTVNEVLVDELCDAQPADNFADSLVFEQRADAAHLAAQLSDEDVLRAFGLLESRLDALRHLHRAVRQRMPEREIATKTGLHRVVIHKFRDVAGKYDTERIRQSRRALVQADARWREGARAGVVELLIAQW
jgi:DNA polymerase III delta subunit